MGFHRGDAVVYVRTEIAHMVAAPARESVSAEVGIVTSATRDGRIKAYRACGHGGEVKLHRHSLEHRMDTYRLPPAQWDIAAIETYCATRPWAHAPQHTGAPFSGIEQARAELQQFRRVQTPSARPRRETDSSKGNPDEHSTE